MKILVKTAGILLLAGVFSACGDNTTSGTSGSDTTKMDNMATKMDTAARMDNTVVATPIDTTAKPNTMAGNDQETINYLVTKNTKEIAWLQAAMDKSSSKDIKDHAAMMLKDHKKLDGEVKSYLEKHTALTMPAKPDVSNEVTINDKKGKDWDNAWLDKMDTEHKELVEKLQAVQTSAKDDDLRKMAGKTIPVVESHIKMIAMCKKM